MYISLIAIGDLLALSRSVKENQCFQQLGCHAHTIRRGMQELTSEQNERSRSPILVTKMHNRDRLASLEIDKQKNLTKTSVLHGATSHIESLEQGVPKVLCLLLSAIV